MGGVAAPGAAAPAAPAAHARARRPAHDTEEILALREQKAAAEDEQRSLLAQLAEADAAVAAAEDALRRAAGTADAVEAASCVKAALHAELGDAERSVASAVSALNAALGEQIEKAAAARRVARGGSSSWLILCLPNRRQARADARTPERISARVASRPRKTYAEDEEGLAEASPGGRECVVRLVEDRRYGIYDNRRVCLPFLSALSAAEPLSQALPSAARRRG